MKPIKVLLTGAAGRMGQEIVELAKSDSQIQIVLKVDRPGKGDFASLPSSGARPADVVVDFSAPEFLRDILNWCLQTKTPIVSGTTGLIDTDYELLKKVSHTVPVLWSANMSMGIALVAQLLKSFGAVADEFTFQIEEVHHHRKVDAPSGTALYLQRELEAAVDKTVSPPLSIRGGGVFGIHKIWVMGEEETITIEHTALNRRVFARGALRAAQWLATQSPGLYTVNDALGFHGAKN